jgi:tRNA 2-(methylsulfanyl)-N6-isopentenyladenosine37 hydroxylase
VLCLTYPTDPSWAALAAGDLPSLLSDHAHCEMKAASNALSLAARWTAYPRLVEALAAIAEEELRHFRAVLAELSRRGIALGKPEVDVYAAELRKAGSQRGRHAADAALVDRLLVGALIEARSCERFRLLGRALSDRGEAPLAAFYDDLFTAEARHYTTFVDLAIDVAVINAEAVRARLLELSKAEGELVARLKLGTTPTMHG